MPKSSRPKTQQASKESTIQPTRTENSISILLRKIVTHPIVTMIGMIPFALVYDALRSPDISSALNGDPSRPFAFPFSVKNNSSWFRMLDAKIYCEIKKVVMTNNHSVEGIPVVEISRASIWPEEVVNFRCDVASTPGQNLVVEKSVGIIEANISIVVQYTMLAVLRTSHHTAFTWYAEGAPPHWIKGEIAK